MAPGFSPGMYLRKSRQRAGKSLIALASEMVRLPYAVRSANVREINALADRSAAAECDRAPLTGNQVRLIAEIVPIKPERYQLLANLAAAAAMQRINARVAR